MKTASLLIRALIPALLICVLLPFQKSLASEIAAPEESPTLYEISLLTFSPTDNLFEWFGHTALTVTNRRTGSSIAYNFGGFSFGADDFLMFTMGRFVFWSYAQETGKMVQRYRKKGRHIIIQKLDLNRRQSNRIRRNLMRSMLPQNRFYNYDHFKDNCATRLRDIVDDALDGAIHSQSSDKAGITYRDLVHRMTAHQPLLNFLLNFILSDGVDAEISYWETMFLPDRQMAVFGGIINPKTGRPLVKIRDEIMPGSQSHYFEDTVTIPDTSTRNWLIGLSLGALMALCAWLYPSSPSTNNPTEGLHHKLYPLGVAVYGAVFGLLGIVLFFMTVIASHKDVYWNENFFLLNPLTFLLLPLGLLRLWGKARRFFAATCICCAISGTLGLALKIMPSFNQVNEQQLIILLPTLLIIGVTGLIDY